MPLLGSSGAFGSGNPRKCTHTDQEKLRCGSYLFPALQGSQELSLPWAQLLPGALNSNLMGRSKHPRTGEDQSSSLNLLPPNPFPHHREDGHSPQDGDKHLQSCWHPPRSQMGEFPLTNVFSTSFLLFENFDQAGWDSQKSNAWIASK